jgi:hypothetical protein
MQTVSRLLKRLGSFENLSRNGKGFDTESSLFVPSMNSGRALLSRLFATKGESRKPILRTVEGLGNFSNLLA